MAKQIKFTYEDKQYTLEFTRSTVEMLERQGLSLKDIGEKPMSVLPKLFAGAFLVHHKFEKKETINNIFSKMTNREELFSTLIDMYNEPYLSMMDEPEEDEGNVGWTVN